MRVTILVLLTAAASALLMYLWMTDQAVAPDPETGSSADAPVQEDPAEELAPSTGLAAAEEPGLAGRPQPKRAEATVSDGGGGITVTGAGNLGDSIRAVRDAFIGQIREKDARIRELEAKLERLTATLPKPEVLQELELASTEEISNLLREMRSVVSRRLLTPPAHISGQFADFLAQEGSGVARILPRGKFDKLVEPRGGGAYWSFKTGSNSYDEEPDLELQAGYYGTGFYGASHGYLMDLGDYPIDNVDADEGRPPAGLAEQALEQWAWVWKPTEAESERRADRRRIPGTNPSLKGRIKAHTRHTYLLRAILPGEHDILVVFRPVEGDETGVSLVYRILHEFEMPKRR